MKYALDVTSPNSHEVAIKLEFTANWDNPILEMPVWTPGSYKIRDYSRHVISFSTDTDHKWKKISKNQWQITASKGDIITVSYNVYCLDLSVRTSYLDDRYALLSPASLFFYQRQKETTLKNKEITLKLVYPDDWEIFTSLPQKGNQYIAEDFDMLIDSPIGLGHKSVVDHLDYSISNGDGSEVPCRIALIGHRGNHNLEEFKEFMINLQQTSIKMLGTLPYDHYLWVLYLSGGAGGGLEHKFSNFSIINRWYFDQKDKLKFAKMLSLEAHEHFHSYNIKRIRPDQLGPFDYSKEVYTTLLWMAEGITSFYDNIFLPRGDMIEEDIYWQIIAKDLTQLRTIPGRKLTSLSSSSFDSWIKYYQKHEGLDNYYVSYYLKGGLVAFMLDLEIRKQTDWEKSLDNFYQVMYKQYLQSKEGFDESMLRQLIEQATGTTLGQFWQKYIDGTAELPFGDYLSEIGMIIEPEEGDVPYTGIVTNSNKNRVSKVRANSPAMQAGIIAKDKLIAFDGHEVTNDSYEKMLREIGTGKSFKVHLIRDGILRVVDMELTSPKPEKFVIKPMDNPSAEQIKRRDQFFYRD